MPGPRYWDSPDTGMTMGGKKELMRTGPTLPRTEGFRVIILELEGYSER